MVMAAAGVVTVAAGSGWIAKLDTSANLDIGRGIGVDGSGNVYVTGQANSSSVTTACVFIAKYNSAGTIQWQRSLDTLSVDDIGYRIAVDATGNVYVTGRANTATAVAYAFIAKYDTSGVIQWQRKLDTTSSLDVGYGIAVDGSGNVYVTGQCVVTAAYVFIAKYDTTGVIQWQRTLDVVTLDDTGYGIAVDGSGNVYVTGQSSTAAATSYAFIAKYDTTGVIQWQRKLDTASVADVGYGIAVDGSGNVYVTGQANTTSAAYVFIAKYDTTGVIQWQRKLDTDLVADVGYGIAVDGSGNVYVTGQSSTAAATSYVFIAKYDTTGVIQWQRKLDTATVIDAAYGIAVDGSGNVYVTGQANTTSAAYVFIAKLPADGTIPKTGTYVVSGSTLTYSASTMTEAAATLTDAAGTLTPVTLSLNHWIATLDTLNQRDIGYGIAVDTTGNVYVTGLANLTAAYVFIAKYNTSGVIQWQRSLDVASNTDMGRGIAVDSSGNVYVTGQANGASTVSYVFIAKYDTTGVIQWQVILDTVMVSELGYGIAADGSGNVYVTGQIDGGSATYLFIAKYNTSGVIQWQRKLDTASQTDIGFGIAVDGSGNVYVTGQSNTTAASYAFIVKYNTSGVIQWQRSLDTATVADIGYGIAADSAGNVYVTGQANTTTNAYAFIAKYDTSGVIQWQRKLDTTSSLDVGYGIAVDGSGNVYVTGQANGASTVSYAFIAKYDTTGVIQWQRKLDIAPVADVGYGIAVDGSGNVYVTGAINNVGATTANIVIAKLLADGSILPGTSTLTMAASTMIDSAATMSSDDPTLCWVATLNTDLVTDVGYGIAVDGSGNVYVTGQANATTATASYTFIAKYNTSGVIQWQRKLDTDLVTDIGYGIAVDSSGNVYVTGQTNSGNAAAVFIAKYNTSGVIQWQRKLDTTSVSVTDLGRGIAVDGSGNVYVTGWANSSLVATSYAFIAKYDTNGVIQWQRFLDTANVVDVGYGIAVDGSGNVYVTGQANPGGATSYVFIAKYDTSGVIQWQRTLDTGLVTDIGYGIAVDTTGNVYVTGQANTSTASYAFIAKYDTSGTIQWQRKLDTASQPDIGYGIAVDGNANVYITGQANTANAADVFIAKYDTSGVIQWQRSLNTASVSAPDMGRGIAVDGSGNVYVTGQANTANAASVFIAKLPGSGLVGAGTATLSYGVSTLTDAAGTLTDAAGTLTDAAGTLTDSVATMTDAEATMTSTTTSMAMTDSAGSMGTVNISNLWMAIYNTAGNGSDDYGYCIAIDSSDNLYVGGGVATNQAYIAKYNSSGTLQWQRFLKSAAGIGNDKCYGIAVDGSGNVHVTGLGYTATSGVYAFIAKYNTSGIIQWQRKLDTANPDRGNGIAVDGSGNIYVVGQANGNSTSNSSVVFTAKYNASGVIQWQRFLDNAAQIDSGNSIAVNSAGDVYITGGDLNPSNIAIIAKYNTSGVIQWQRYLYNQSTGGAGITLDSTGDVYVVGNTNGNISSSSVHAYIAKYNSAGVIQWQRDLYTVSGTPYFRAVTVDNAGNVYATGSHNGQVIIAKYNTAGTYNWCLQVGNLTTSSLVSGYGVVVDSIGNPVIYGTAATLTSDTLALLFKVSPIGSLLSTTMSGVSLQNTTLSDQSGTNTDGVGTKTESAGNLTDSAGDMTDSAGNITSTRYSAYMMLDTAATMTSTTTIQGIPDAAASMTDSVASMTSTTLTL
jgi:uncharacterized delta-60 repeat protein